MKRVGFLYEKICSKENVELAFNKAIKGKKSRGYIKRILKKKDYYIEICTKILQDKTYKPSAYRTKVIYDRSSMKERLICVPKFFPEQIIHWALMLQIQPIISRGMYKYCCGSVPKRGGMAAFNFTKRAVRDKKNKYVAKLDIHKFFPSINCEILYSMFKRKIKDKDTLHLIKQILDNGKINGKGLPIGYYTSQWFSNFYLEGLDHFIKDELQIKSYVRYVDDIVMLDSNKRKLHKAIERIREYLKTIGLELKPNYQVWKKDSRPIDFVGFQFYSNRLRLRKRLYFHFKRRLNNLKPYITIKQARGISAMVGWFYHIKCYIYEKLESFVSSIIRRNDLRYNIAKQGA